MNNKSSFQIKLVLIEESITHNFLYQFFDV